MDYSHLEALEVGLSHERQRLADAKTPAERTFRQVLVAQSEREVAGERAHLGLGAVDAAAVDDDTLLALLDQPESPPKPVTPKPESGWVRDLAIDLVRGPRPLYPIDPYGLTYPDQSASEMWDLLPEHYGTEKEPFEQALIKMSDGLFNSNVEVEGKRTILKELIGLPQEYSWSHLARALHSNALDMVLADLPEPATAIPAGLQKAVGFFGPLSQDLGRYDLTSDPQATVAYNWDLRIAREIVVEEVAKLDSMSERDPGRQRIAFERSDLQAMVKFLQTIPRPSAPFPPVAVRAGATTDEQAAVYWVRWFTPRFATKHTPEGLSSPGEYSYGNSYANIGDFLAEFAQEFDPTWAKFSREIRYRILQAAGHKYKAQGSEPPTYGDRPLSEGRVIGWLRNHTNTAYGDNPWTLTFTPSGVAATLVRYSSAIPWTHQTLVKGGKRDQLHAFVTDVEFWHAYYRHTLDLHAYTNIKERWNNVQKAVK
jgi:hypothetical protein